VITTVNKKEESQYARSLIEASCDPLITINTKGKITDMNQATINIIGVSRKKLTGSNFFDFFTEPQKAQDVYKEVFAKGSVSDLSLTLCHSKGKLTDVLFNGSVYKDDKGTVQGVVIVARDVTEQKRIARESNEDKLFAELAKEHAEEAKIKAEKATKIAQNAVKSKQQFLSNMSHEIRTPMNAIIGFTKVLLKTSLSGKQKEYLSAIELSGNSLIVLINDILDLAKVDAGKMQFEKIPFNLASSITAILHLFELKIHEKNLILEKEYDSLIPAVLIGDPVRLHQIILNLVSNAVKFTSKGKITIRVKIENEEEKSFNIRFSVQDTGIGIDEDKLFNIFENFQQATSGTSRLYGGTGLGLAIVKKLVESQDGSIEVESKIKQGSTFSFVLNFLKTDSKTETETEIIEISTTKLKLNVLVVEDIPLNQLLMKTILDDFGFENDMAPNGLIAIEKLKSNTYDIVLMDLQMPEMNGFEATEFIRKNMKLNIPIMALTADVTTVDLAKCKEVGMNDYIAKPLDDRLLHSKILKLVKKQQLKNDTVNTTTKQHLQLKHCNLDYLTRLTKSNPVLMNEMISLFLIQTPTLVKLINDSLASKDYKSLYLASHKMIPSFSIMGINKEYEKMAKQVQEYAGANQHLDKIPPLVIKLENIFKNVCDELDKVILNINDNYGK
jgi:PAS domain S-box-containing protein